jgi:intraflagellar transport protein 74
MRPPSRTRAAGEISAPSRGVSVVNRPMSNQGLPSAHTASGSRQVADKSYFIGILRTKMNEILKEIERIEAQNEQSKRGQSIQVSLAEHASELQKEIAAAEAELADYNVLNDRLAHGVTAEDMSSGHQVLLQSNRQYEDKVNKIFREKRELEGAVLDQEQQIQEAMSGNSSPELQAMLKEIESLETQCQELRSQTGDLQGKTREELLQIVKETANAIGDTDKQIQEEQKGVNYVQNQIKTLEERQGDLQTDRGQQYVKLLQREKDMNRFIQNYPQTLEAAKQDLAAAQRRVFEGLVSTSRDIESVNELPSVDNFQNMQSDLRYKERQMEDARVTMEKLQAEVQQRRREFDDLKNVDKTIQDEIVHLKQKMVEMEAEMPRFADVDSVREEGEIKKKMQTHERDHLKSQLLHLRRATNALATKYNESRTALRANDIENKLVLLEKEIRTRAAENNTTAESIEENRRRTNYTLVKRAALAIVTEINAML